MSQLDAAVVIDVKHLQRVFLKLQAMGDAGKCLTTFRGVQPDRDV